MLLYLLIFSFVAVGVIAMVAFLSRPAVADFLYFAMLFLVFVGVVAVLSFMIWLMIMTR